MTLTLKTINADLAKHGQKARLERGDGYFYFWAGEARDWLDRTVRVPHSGEPHAEAVGGKFQRLKKLNADIINPPRKKN